MMGGIGDNYQLYMLLADRLAARVPGLQPPERHWVAATTDTPPALPAGAVIQRRCRLFDGHGSYVYPEGRPDPEFCIRRWAGAGVLRRGRQGRGAAIIAIPCAC